MNMLRQILYRGWTGALLLLIATCAAGAGDRGGTDGERPRASASHFFWEKAKGLLAKHPRRYARNISRGELNDAVVLLKDGQVQLGSLLESLEPGSYFLLWRQIVAAGEMDNKKEVGPIAVNWNPPSPAIQPARTLNVGLYDVSVFEKDGDRLLRRGSGLWVLVSNPAEYPRASAAFQEAESLAADQKNDLSPGFTRAVLDALAH